MEHRPLGNSGLFVSEFGLGTMTFGAEADEPMAHAILDRFVEAGGTLIDTADVYSMGAAELIVGNWLAKRGDTSDLVIASKGRFAVGSGTNAWGASRAHLHRAVDASLSRLGVDAIDLYQVHAWDPHTPLEETLHALHELVTIGKVRYIGISNFTGWQAQRAVMLARHANLSPVVSFQGQYSLLGRELEMELLPVCLEEHLGVFAWSPLAGGWLTGKYSQEERPAGATRLGENPSRGIEAYDLRNRPQTWEVLDAVGEIATAREVPLSQVALNWVRHRPGISSVLLGVRSLEQLETNLGAVDWHLGEDETHRLTTVSAPGIPLYPHGFLETYADMDMWELLGTRSEPPPIGA